MAHVPLTQIMCLQLPLAYGGVGIWAELRGLSLDSLSNEEISLALLGSDVLQLVGVLAIIKNNGLATSIKVVTANLHARLNPRLGF